MKILCKIFVLGVLISCTEANENNYRFELVPEPDKDIREEYEVSVEEQKPETETAEADWDPLEELEKPIRRQMQAVTAIDTWTSVTFDSVAFNNQAGTAASYYFAGELRKLETVLYGKEFNIKQTFYFEGNALILLAETSTDLEEKAASQGHYDPNIDTFFLVNDSVIHAKMNKDYGGLFPQEYLNRETTRIQGELKQIIIPNFHSSKSDSK